MRGPQGRGGGACIPPCSVHHGGGAWALRGSSQAQIFVNEQKGPYEKELPGKWSAPWLLSLYCDQGANGKKRGGGVGVGGASGSAGGRTGLHRASLILSGLQSICGGVRVTYSNLLSNNRPVDNTHPRNNQLCVPSSHHAQGRQAEFLTKSSRVLFHSKEPAQILASKQNVALVE